MPLDKNDLNASDHMWLLGSVAMEDGTLLVRLNESANQWAGHPDLGIKLGFAIPFKLPPKGGVPNADENESLGELEDKIIATVTSQATGIHVLALTAPTVKELIFYISEGADIGAIHEHLQSLSTTHDVQCMAVRDADWNSYYDFFPEGRK
ncbi:DUF695 domain-containing protein [Stieleria sp. JC731]|uniref:DUF695 domain-containing protein n=1 Tax=Pirellulaceae TaxID=2691357 RepID=UPI001E36EDF3|nr:DUF695 domain-containing protein [Stieleria sp. JC731]MCC9603700.1 DUF695 domain-containing protein [Stieleria sp. JC731]